MFLLNNGNSITSDLQHNTANIIVANFARKNYTFEEETGEHILALELYRIFDWNSYSVEQSANFKQDVLSQLTIHQRLFSYVKWFLFL